MTYEELLTALVDMGHRCDMKDTVEVLVQVDTYGCGCCDDDTIERRLNAESIQRCGRVIEIFARGDPLPRRGG